MVNPMLSLSENNTWPHNCHRDLEATIKTFKENLPYWWYTVGECQVSCDATCAPTRMSEDIALINLDDRFNSAFRVDLRQPANLAEALYAVMHEALIARNYPGRSLLELQIEEYESAPSGVKTILWILAEDYQIEISDCEIVIDPAHIERADGKRAHGTAVISLLPEEANKIMENAEIIDRFGFDCAKAIIS